MRREQSEHPALRIRSGAGYGGGSSTAGFGVEASGGSGSGWQSDTMKDFDNQLNTNLGKKQVVFRPFLGGGGGRKRWCRGLAT